MYSYITANKLSSLRRTTSLNLHNSDTFKQPSKKDYLNYYAPNKHRPVLSFRSKCLMSKGLAIKHFYIPAQKKASLLVLKQPKRLCILSDATKRDNSKIKENDYYSFVNLTKCKEAKRFKRKTRNIARPDMTSTKDGINDTIDLLYKPITKGCIIIRKRL